MRILVVTRDLPWPISQGAKIRDYHLLREAAKEAEVVLLALCKDDRDNLDPRELRRFCAEVETYVPPEWQSWMSMGAHWRAGRPMASYPYYFDAFAKRITELAFRHRVDLVQVEHTFLAPYRDAIPPGCRAILSLHNIGERQYGSMVGLSTSRLPSLLKAAAMRRWEGHWARRFDHCITVSATDADWLRQRTPRQGITVVENGVDCERYQPLPPPAAGNDLLFVGLLVYSPNADAVIHFVRHILPLVRRSTPSARLIIVGRKPPRDVQALTAQAGVELHDDVADVTPFYQRARACVVPLRAGGGTRLKILEAMAMGRPVISTSKGCEGLEVRHGNELLVADSPEAMAGEVARVLANPELAAGLCARARLWVEERHDWRILGARLRQLYRDVLAGPVETAI